MLDPTLSSGYLANLAATLTAGVLSALGRRLRQKIAGTPQEQALVRCYRAGSAALLPEDDPLRGDYLPVLQAFFGLPSVEGELAKLVRGREPDVEVLLETFAEETEGLDFPPFEFEARLARFVEAFLQAAELEPELQETIQTAHLREATASLRTLVADMAAIRQALSEVGYGGVSAGGDLQARDIITGTQINIHSAPGPADPGLELERKYLQALQKQVIELPLAALDDEGADSRVARVTLNQVYIALNTRSTVPLSKAEKEKEEFRFRDERPLTALEAAAHNRRLALLGDPGSGKSVFVNHLAYRLAGARLAGQDEAAGWSGPPHLPVRVILRDLAADLANLDAAKLAALPPARQTQQLLRAWRTHLRKQFTTFDLSAVEAEAWVSCLHDETWRGECLYIFDGLDEVPVTQLGQVRQTIEGLAARHEGPLLVTCRVRSYEGAATLAGFAVETLAPFTFEQIDDFIAAWYQAQPALTDARRGSRIRDLSQVVRQSELTELAHNPLLLTTMALVHTAGVGLPKERVRLYSRSVEVLMRRWQRHKHGQAAILEQLGIDATRLLGGLWALAYRAHQGGEPGENADIDKDAAVGLLAKTCLNGDYGRAQRFLEYVDQQAGLLVGRGGSETRPIVYSFAHRTFQEYLAGCYLALSERGGLARALRGRLAEGERWYLAGQLAAEHLLYNVGREHEVLDLLYQLCPVHAPGGESDWRAVAWAGVLAAEVGADRIRSDHEAGDGGQHFLDRLLPRLQTLIAAGKLTIAERADAGDALACLEGDTRPGVGLTPDGLPDIAWCFIPAGPFWLGSIEGEDDLAYDDEYGHTEPVALPYPYWLARYPVTQGQYRAFVQATGYQAPDYEAEWARPYNWRDAEPPADKRNHPLVLVSWDDAVAYCAWLDEQLGAVLPPGYGVRLPSEAEWEKGARGGLEIPVAPQIVTSGESFSPQPAGLKLGPNPHPKRRWPWGTWEADSPLYQANVGESRSDRTMAVGSFPAGASPYGCLDLAGNVWEWTLSLYRPYPYQPDDRNDPEAAGNRTLRGGAWSDGRRHARVSARNLGHPDYFLFNFGVPLVVAPV